jgi:hypothetical protein
MRIEGHIAIWFNPNSLFKMEFNKVDVVEAIAFLKMIQSALTAETVPQDMPYHETEQSASEAEGA